MAKTYKILSEAGAIWAGSQLGRPVEVGEEVELKLEHVGEKHGQERALLAAEWLEESKKKGKGE